MKTKCHVSLHAGQRWTPSERTQTILKRMDSLAMAMPTLSGSTSTTPRWTCDCPGRTSTVKLERKSVPGWWEGRRDLGEGHGQCQNLWNYNVKQNKICLKKSILDKGKKLRFCFKHVLVPECKTWFCLAIVAQVQNGEFGQKSPWFFPWRTGDAWQSRRCRC